MESHIPSAAGLHARYFKMFIECLVERFQPLQIFCFAKTKLLSETTGCFRDQQSSYHCNYCLLLVTEANTRIDHEVQAFSNQHYQQGVISILCHSQESISEAIKANSRFFITVYITGQLLYTHNGLSHLDFTGKFIPTQSAKKAQKHFDHRMPLAEGFLRGANACLAKHDFNVSTFMLHQVVEQCCILLIRVQVAYRSEVHNLYRMLGICCCFSDRPYKLFLPGSPEDQRLFDLLVKSYSRARYAGDFAITEDDARHLYQRAADFVTLTKMMCLETIQKLDEQAISYQESTDELSLIN
jgi:hypothetical protein